MSRLIHLLGAGSVLALGLAVPQAIAQVADDELQLCSEVWDARTGSSGGYRCINDETGEPTGIIWWS